VASGASGFPEVTVANQWRVAASTEVTSALDAVLEASAASSAVTNVLSGPWVVLPARSLSTAEDFPEKGKAGDLPSANERAVTITA